jgi:hypothetical protein
MVLALLLQAGQFALLGSPMAGSPAAVAGLAQYSLITAALACLCGGLSDLAAGALYAGTHPREGFELGDGLLGGAAAGALARVVSGAGGLGIGLLLMPLLYPRIAALSGGALRDSAVLFSLAGGTLGGILGIIISAIFGAGLAALSGGLLTAFRTRSA